MKKLLKLDTIDGMHKQLDLPNGKYGVVVAVVNVQSMYTPQDQLPLEIYPLLKSGAIEINTMYYSDTTEVLESGNGHIDISVDVMACELDATNLAGIAGVYPAEGLKPYALVAILNEETLHNFKVSKITLVDVNGVLKADVVINPLLPVTDVNVDSIDASIFKLSFIPYTDFINNNYCIAYDTNSLNSILAMNMLLSNRNDISDIDVVDYNELIVGDDDRVSIMIDSDGNMSIDGSAYTNTLDVIKNMCTVLNIDFTGTELMLEMDSIIRGEAGYSNIKKILTEIISTDDGKAGFIENTIPMVTHGMYKSFTNFFNNELLELTIRKRIAKEILDAAQVVHNDFYTVTIIDSNILVDEIIEVICRRELDNPLEDHIYVINSSHTDYSTINYFSFNNPDILELFVGNLEDDFDVTIDDYIDNPSLFTSNIDTINDLLLSYTINTSTIYDIGSRVLKPRYCKIEKSL